MIPTEEEAKMLWDKYHLPKEKRIHVTLVARAALFLAKKLQEKYSDIQMNKPLLFAAALLHDIDKAITRNPGEHHPDTAVRVLREEGMSEVADVVKTHSLRSILDDTISPKTWEEKLLYLADKMVKYDIITVDKRFALWKAEDLSADAQWELNASYPKVKELEKEICELIGITPGDLPVQAGVAKFV